MNQAAKHEGGKGHGGGGHKKHKKHEEGLKVDAPMWMMSWADMVTLLMALFVAMYSISNLDIVKYQIFLKGIRGEFSQEEGETALEAKERGMTHQVVPPAEVATGEGKLPGDSDVTPVERDLHGRSSRWRDKGEAGVAVRVHFREASYELDAGGIEYLRRFASTVRGYESRLEIRGHCSAGESEVARNLSFLRAMAVYEYLSDPRLGRIAEDRLKVTAMGTADPLNRDQSPFEKGENRLVEVMEVPEYNSKLPAK